MKRRSCPRCRHASFYSNEVFWVCAECGYAMTDRALSIDEDRAGNSRTVSPGASD